MFVNDNWRILNKSPLAPLYKRGGIFEESPFSKGGFRGIFIGSPYKELHTGAN